MTASGARPALGISKFAETVRQILAGIVADPPDGLTNIDDSHSLRFGAASREGLTRIVLIRKNVAIPANIGGRKITTGRRFSAYLSVSVAVHLGLIGSSEGVAI